VRGVSAKNVIVFEVWESKATQEAYMNERLGAALAQAGAPAPNRMEWLDVPGGTRHEVGPCPAHPG
jgi:hypothetical protein